MKAVNPNASADYVPECDRDLKPEEQTVFQIGQLSAEEQAYLKDIQNLGGSSINIALHLGLTGVRNLADANGDAIQLKRDNTVPFVHGKKRPWSNLTVIPMKVRDELAGRIIRGAEVEEPEVKNS